MSPRFAFFEFVRQWHDSLLFFLSREMKIASCSGLLGDSQRQELGAAYPRVSRGQVATVHPLNEELRTREA